MKVVAWCHAGLYRVMLDGVDVTARCIEADDLRGTATLHVIDDNGTPILRPDRLGFVIEDVQGSVRLEKIESVQ